MHISGFTYEVTITTYTNTNTAALSRNFLQIDWGDGTSDSIPRLADTPIPGIGQKNTYRTRHTFAGPGSYTISMEDQNRNANVANIPISVNQAFYIESTLTIVPGLAPNNSPQLLNPPIDRACTGEIFIHNPAAYDPDGDSLAYFLAPSLGNGGVEILGYTYPNASITVDAKRGDLIWDAPAFAGEFNVAIRIEEYREGVLIGSVLRDIQIEVGTCTNTPPVISSLPDTCVVAGDTLNFEVIATDVEGGQLTLEAYGGPFEIGDPASFPTTIGTGQISNMFNWATQCAHVRKYPYTVVFKSTDIGDVNLAALKSMQITVIAPPVQNLVATPAGNTIQLSWSTSVCSNATGYKVYRRSGATGFTPGYCETGVPPYLGYSLIGNVEDATVVNYVDQDGLVHGNTYCYLIVACFADGAESIASEEVCTTLIKDVPVITHVSVGSTGPAGRDTVIWSRPTEIDTVVQWPGPYEYRIYRSTGYENASTLVGTTAPSAQLSMVDTVFVESGVNTEASANTYRIEVYSGASLIGSTLNGSSVFLESTPNDNQIGLSWIEEAPWSNYRYFLYRQNKSNLAFELLAQSSSPVFIDDALVNGEEYCYKVRTRGQYTGSSIMKPLDNWSQEICDIPLDLTPPCPPQLLISENCENGLNTLVWNNPNNSCADDVLQYEVWFSPSLTDSLQQIQLISGSSDTTFEHGDMTSVAGCYEIVAIDSVGNRSEPSNRVCVDNCPYYALPNVFSPNNDGSNDAFRALPYRYIDAIQLQIFNRWGELVFETGDPAFVWNAQHKNGKGAVSQGTYYYVCRVDERRLAGVTSSEFAGHVTILYEKGKYTIE